VGDAEALPYQERSFDAVVMNFGVLHLSRPEAAFAEARRVLASSGRFAFTVWRPPEEARGFALMLRAIETAGDSQVPLPPGPPFFRFSDPAECELALSAAGFANVRATVLPLAWSVPSADELYEAFYAGTARTGGLLRAQSHEAAAAIRETVRASCVEFLQPDGSLRIPMPALLVAAQAH
jgi:SAM-dependent methyltransferase